MSGQHFRRNVVEVRKQNVFFFLVVSVLFGSGGGSRLSQLLVGLAGDDLRGESEVEVGNVLFRRDRGDEGRLDFLAVDVAPVDTLEEGVRLDLDRTFVRAETASDGTSQQLLDQVLK